MIPVSYRCALLCAGFFVALPFSARAADYTPPPLFGTPPAALTPEKKSLSSVGKPLPLVPAENEIPGVADASENAPVDIGALLSHPADKIDDDAEKVMKSYTKKGPKHPVVPVVRRVVPPQKPTIIENLKPTVTTQKIEGPKFKIFSRDPKTGNFVEKDTADRVIRSSGQEIDIRHDAPKEVAVLPAPPPPPSKNEVAEVTALVREKETRPVSPLNPVNLAPEEILETLDTSDHEEKAVPLPVPGLFEVEPRAGTPKKPVIEEKQNFLLIYKPQLTTLSNELRQSLTENVLVRLNKNPAMRVEIRAYASPTEEGQSSDRRISLARALEVREFLKGQGIDAARMDVRALGRNSPRDPIDHVDVVFVGG